MLTLETGCGLSLTGLSTTQDRITALTIMMSRETTRMTSQSGIGADDRERDIDRNQHRLVGERVEIGAERGRHAEALGQKAVDRVADAGGEEQAERDPHFIGCDRPDHHRHQ